MSDEIKNKEFQLESRDEVERFEVLFSKYQRVGSNVAPLSTVSLTDAWDCFESRSDGRRLFAAFLDLWISFVFLFNDMVSIGKVSNKSFSKGMLEGGTILDSTEKFIGKMTIHRYSTSYVLRYRAFWDKWMGMMILLHRPSMYDEFGRARSRRRFFQRRFAREMGSLGDMLVMRLEFGLGDFDDTFRTSEAHGAGVLRKWTLSMQSMGDNPSVELVGYWNRALKAMADLKREIAHGHFADPKAES